MNPTGNTVPRGTGGARDLAAKDPLRQPDLSDEDLIPSRGFFTVVTPDGQTIRGTGRDLDDPNKLGGGQIRRVFRGYREQPEEAAPTTPPTVEEAPAQAQGTVREAGGGAPVARTGLFGSTPISARRVTDEDVTRQIGQLQSQRLRNSLRPSDNREFEAIRGRMQQQRNARAQQLERERQRNVAQERADEVRAAKAADALALQGAKDAAAGGRARDTRAAADERARLTREFNERKFEFDKSQAVTPEDRARKRRMEALDAEIDDLSDQAKDENSKKEGRSQRKIDTLNNRMAGKRKAQQDLLDEAVVYPGPIAPPGSGAVEGPINKPGIAPAVGPLDTDGSGDISDAELTRAKQQLQALVRQDASSVWLDRRRAGQPVSEADEKAIKKQLQKMEQLIQRAEKQGVARQSDAQGA
ncbi:MAG: hypothetical protein GY851_00400 [bacterium]|nr:hypothetical protein [bacterium]